VIDESRVGPYAHWLAERGAIPRPDGWERCYTNDLLLGAGAGVR
jgi:NitT/TauT family transport system substrate-binding protein